MAYVQRDGTGKITGVFANQQLGYATELLADTDPTLIAFLNPVVPNSVDFAQAVKTGLGGILVANQLMTLYPAFFPAIQTQNWADLQTLILDAKAKLVITLAQYTSIKTAAGAFNIPVVLP
jgi:hypothetical protein